MPEQLISKTLGAQGWLGLGMLAIGLLAAATLEGVWLNRRRAGSYDWRAYFSSLGDAALRWGVQASGLSMAAPLLLWAWEHRLTTVALDTASSLFLLFLCQEFFYYVYHRAAHRVRWFWASHAVHHSPNQLTLANAVRLGFTGPLTGAALFFAPLVWLGFPAKAVLGMVALNLLYQFWIHAAWIPRLWWPLEWFFNTPAHHRVHHASNPQYLDCNFGGVLIIFDRLFGTWCEEIPGVQPRYGLTSPLHTYNPIRVALHEWILLAQDLVQTRGWSNRMVVLFGPPSNQRHQPHQTK